MGVSLLAAGQDARVDHSSKEGTKKGKEKKRGTECSVASQEHRRIASCKVLTCWPEMRRWILSIVMLINFTVRKFVVFQIF